VKKISVQKLCDSATLPTKSHSSDAGWDLYASEEVSIPKGSTVTISTEIAFAIPEGYVGLIWDRSSLGSQGIHRHAGVIDSSYRGHVKVCLHNNAQETYVVKKEDRIAQIIFQETPPFDLEEVGSLSETQRGGHGFGSTGK
tara:strand:- start:65662 stop:66084 length:423 start_codon:yes stop_codon:yes gene_type:complete